MKGQRLPVGVAQSRSCDALYGEKHAVHFYKTPTQNKRQPAGTGRRWPGAFGLVPGLKNGH